MFTKSLQIGLMGFVLSVATAWAGQSAIQGLVKDVKGQAIKGADVRVESRDGKTLFKTVKTDGSGRYVSDGLASKRTCKERKAHGVDASDDRKPCGRPLGGS